MKKLKFISLCILLTTGMYSQWRIQAVLPYDSAHVPQVRQVAIIDSAFSWFFGTTNISSNGNYEYPYIAKKTSSGFSMIQHDLDISVRGRCIAATDSLNIWLGTVHPSEIYHSTNGGVNWFLQKHVDDTGHVLGITFCKQNKQIGYAFSTLAANTFWNGVCILKTTNSGLSWTRWDFVYYGYLCADNSISVVDSNYAWFGVENVIGGSEKIIMTSNGGISWNITEVESGMGGPFTIQFSASKDMGLYVGETPPYSWIYRTTNSGLNWNIVYTTTYYYSKAMVWVQGSSNIYGSSEFALIRSVDNGASWHTMSGGPGNYLESLDAIRLNNELIYALAVTRDRKVYKLLDTVKAIGIGNEGTGIPTVFRLYQNYPNPFNPQTTIKYDNPKNGSILIKIYDILGRVVHEVNEFKNAGSYEIKFDGSKLASGIYFYSITSGTFKDTKKMVLVK